VSVTTDKHKFAKATPENATPNKLDRGRTIRARGHGNTVLIVLRRSGDQVWARPFDDGYRVRCAPRRLTAAITSTPRRSQ
jgi:hypothetical protein